MRKYLIVAMLFCCSIAFAQNIKRPDTYNYNRGVEAIQNNNAEEALEYLNKELEDNPNNGYALAWIATVRNYQEEYGRALTAVDLAIKHIPKVSIRPTLYNSSSIISLFLWLKIQTFDYGYYRNLQTCLPAFFREWHDRSRFLQVLKLTRKPLLLLAGKNPKGSNSAKWKLYSGKH